MASTGAVVDLLSRLSAATQVDALLAAAALGVVELTACAGAAAGLTAALEARRSATPQIPEAPGTSDADDAGDIVRLVAAHVSVARERLRLRDELRERNQQLTRMLEVAAGVAERLEFQGVAQLIVDGVTDVTDFRVATLTVREGTRCRRVATSGLSNPRIGLTMPFDGWTPLLREEWRQGAISYLVPPEGEAEWADVPDLPPVEGPDGWTAEHALVLPLCDPLGEVIGFLAVDEPRSRRLPTPDTVEVLELFARQVQVALVNARLYEEVKRAAEVDALTGLRNRRSCWGDIDSALARASVEHPLALAVVDIDDFKQVNDGYGHGVGDRALQHVADRLRRSCRQSDTVYRIGGEEFVVLMPATTTEEALTVLERAIDGVRRSRMDLPPLTVSAGVATGPAHGAHADELFRSADVALYTAKHGGKDRVVQADSRLSASPSTSPRPDP